MYLFRIMFMIVAAAFGRANRSVLRDCKAVWSESRLAAIYPALGAAILETFARPSYSPY